MEVHEEYLLEDFKQYHEWMRHYDKSFASMINFLYSGYAAVITAAYILYSKYPNTKEASLGATLLFSFATLLSPVFIFWLMKKRKRTVERGQFFHIDSFRITRIYCFLYGFAIPECYSTFPSLTRID